MEKDKNIVLYSVVSQEIKKSICDRAIRTLKHKSYQYITAHNTQHYLPVLQTLVEIYNTTLHTYLERKTPRQVHILTEPDEGGTNLD